MNQTADFMEAKLAAGKSVNPSKLLGCLFVEPQRLATNVPQS